MDQVDVEEGTPMKSPKDLFQVNEEALLEVKLVVKVSPVDLGVQGSNPAQLSRAVAQTIDTALREWTTGVQVVAQSSQPIRKLKQSRKSFSEEISN